MRTGQLIEGHTASYWSKKSGIDLTIFCRRYWDLGWSLERAMNTPIKRRGIIVNGTYFRGFGEACRAYKIHESTVRGRMNKGMSLEEALTKPVGKDPFRKTKRCTHADCFTCPYDDCIEPT